MEQWNGFTGLFGVLLISSSLWAAERPELENGASAPRRERWVELEDTTGLPASAVASLRSEVDNLYATAGIQVRWLSESPVEIEPYGARVYIMAELPASLATRLRVFGNSSPMAMALGRAGTTSGPVIYISRAAMAIKASGGAVVEPESDEMAKALGRVVAHELAHRFVQSKHTRRGILKADFGESELLDAASSLFFTAGQIEKLQRLAHVAAETIQAGARGYLPCI